MYATTGCELFKLKGDSLQADSRNLGRTLRREGKELRFTTPQGDVLRPLYDLHRQRYVVYWNLKKICHRHKYR